MYKIDWNKYLSDDRFKNASNKQAFDRRNEFDSDFGRVVFCSAFRRMHDKAQVFPLTNGDRVHTRLTHSVEVMNVAQSLIQHICRNDDFIAMYGIQESFVLEQKMSSIVRTAALFHDIGNPPFGHQGERVICKYFNNEGKTFLNNLNSNQKLDFTEFDGNAQGLRVVTKNQYVGTLYGLNLTFATLGSYIKYPNCLKSDINGYVGKHKHGVFVSEASILDRVAESCNMKIGKRFLCCDQEYKRHPLSYLVEAADTICYLVMDLEDGLRVGLVTFDEVVKYLQDCMYKFNVMNAGFGNRVQLRVFLINYLIEKVLDTFKNSLSDIDNKMVVGELLENDPIAQKIREITNNKLFVEKNVVSNELYGEAVLSKLLDTTLGMIYGKEKRILNIISPSMLQVALHEKLNREPNKDEVKDALNILDDFGKLHLVTDWISGMTDRYAVETCKNLYGL